MNRSDAEALAALCDDDLELISVLAVGEGEIYRGKAAWERYLSRMGETWAEWRFEDVEVFEADDELLAAR